MIRLVPAVCLIILVCTSALAEDIVPIKQGTTAPYTGLLVPEGRYINFLEAEQDALELRIRLRIKTKETEALEKMYLDKLRLASEPSAWYDTPTFNRWLGLICGVAVVGLAGWGVAELKQ